MNVALQMEVQLLHVKRVTACRLPEGGESLTPNTPIQKFYFYIQWPLNFKLCYIRVHYNGV